MGSIKDMMDNSYLLRKINELCEQVHNKFNIPRNCV